MSRSIFKIGGALMLLLLLLGVVAGTSFAQSPPTIQYRLVYIGNNTYEVRMQPQDVPSDITTGGQVTVRIPTGEGNVTNVMVPAPYAAAGAQWTLISALIAPPGATQYDYYSYYWDPSLATPGSAAAYEWNSVGQEVVAFTFAIGSGCPASGPVELVDNATDPYITGSPSYDITNNLQISDPSGPIEVFDGLYTGPAGAVEADCTAVPSAPTVVEPVSGATITTTMPVISGSVPITDNVTLIEVKDAAGNVICSDTLDPNLGETTWSCTPTTALPEGLNNLTVVATNGGLSEGAPTPLAVTVDSTPPAAPVITGPTDGSSTNDDTPTISGTAEPGSTVAVTDGAGNPVCTATADAAGDWSCAPTTALPEGTTSLTATPTDPAGNVGTPSAPVDVIVDTTDPAAPAITGPTDGSSTNDDTPTISGTAEPGSTVAVTDGAGNPVCTATADAAGDWSCTPTTALPEGTTSLTATPTDPAGNVGTPSAPVDVIVDTTVPAVPAITGPTASSTISDTTPTITGTGEVSATVNVVDEDDNLLCTTTVAANGTWSCTPTTPLDGGTQTIEVTLTDPAGNTSTPTVHTFTVLAELFIDLKVYLGGAYDFANPTLMKDALRQVTSFPTSDPYSQAPYASKFTHVGGGGETIDAGVLAVTGNDAIVDWVFVELRSTTTNVVATKSALVQRDGNVVAASDGSTMIGFGVAPDNYYIVVRHRNHLGVMTANPVSLSTTPAVVDFATGVGTYGGDGVVAQQAFGSSFGLRPGDADGDGTVKYAGSPNDLSTIRNSFFTGNNFSGSLSYAGPEVTNVYHRGDLNLDGNVRNATDVPVLRNTVLQFPANTEGRLNSLLVTTAVP